MAIAGFLGSGLSNSVSQINNLFFLLDRLETELGGLFGFDIERDDLDHFVGFNPYQVVKSRAARLEGEDFTLDSQLDDSFSVRSLENGGFRRRG